VPVFLTFYDEILVSEEIGVRVVNIPLMKRQFVVTHTIRQTEIPALVDTWFTNISSVNMFSPQKNYTSVGLFRIGQVFLSPVKLCISGLQQIVVSLAIYKKVSVQ
jgi:hypothetical protein